MHKNMGTTQGHARKPRKKKWNELSPMARFGTIAAAIVQLSLLIAAQRDIPAGRLQQIRGSKALWRLATLVNFIGPATLFHLRREAPARHEIGPAAARP